MKLLLAVLFVVLSKVAIEAQLIVAVAKGEHVNFGPLDVNVFHGVLPPKYPDPSNVDMTVAKNLIAYAENQRQHFETGTKVLPPLEPFYKKELDTFDLDAGIVTGRVALGEVVLKGLKQFYLSNLEARVQGYRIDFNVSFPVLDVDVDYTSDTIISGLYPVSYTGHIKGRVTQLQVVGSARFDAVRYLDKTVFQVKAYDVHAGASNVEAQVTGLNLGDAAKVLDANNLGDKNPIILIVKLKVAEAIAKVVTQEFNEVLLHYSASRILKYLTTGQLSS